MGWEKKAGWNYKNPYGSTPKSILRARGAHVSRFEAENYCPVINGRLPTFDEWKSMLPIKQICIL